MLNKILFLFKVYGCLLIFLLRIFNYSLKRILIFLKIIIFYLKLYVLEYIIILVIFVWKLLCNEKL